MHQVDSHLRQLIQLGEQQGFLTFTQVNGYLPDEAVNPEKLDHLLESLEELGLEIIDETKRPAAPRLPKSGGKPARKAKAGGVEGPPRSSSTFEIALTPDGNVARVQPEVEELPELIVPSRPTPGSKSSQKRPGHAPRPRALGEETRPIDDPIRIYLTQMG